MFGQTGKISPHLQAVISAEATLLNSFRKFSADFSRAAEALEAWGVIEGDDFADVLGASKSLMSIFSSALDKYAESVNSARAELQILPQKDQSLLSLRRKLRKTQSKVDVSQRKLAKTDTSGSQYQHRKDNLQNYEAQARSTNLEIHKILNSKREVVRTWLDAKMGSLSTLCRKGVVVAEFGLLVAKEIPLASPEGAKYGGHSRTKFLQSEAFRNIQELEDNTAVTRISVDSPQRVPALTYSDQSSSPGLTQSVQRASLHQLDASMSRPPSTISQRQPVNGTDPSAQSPPAQTPPNYTYSPHPVTLMTFPRSGRAPSDSIGSPLSGITQDLTDGESRIVYRPSSPAEPAYDGFSQSGASQSNDPTLRIGNFGTSSNGTSDGRDDSSGDLDRSIIGDTESPNRVYGK